MDYNYGKSICQGRARLGMSQQDLANKLGCDHSFISRLEQNSRKPGIETLERIAEILDIPLYFLILMSSTNINLENTPPIVLNLILKDALAFIIGGNHNAKISPKHITNNKTF